MWVIYLEVAIALGVAVLIVWFTWPKKPEKQDSMKADSVQDSRD